MPKSLPQAAFIQPGMDRMMVAARKMKRRMLFSRLQFLLKEEIRTLRPAKWMLKILKV
jgi:hypothetical protein